MSQYLLVAGVALTVGAIVFGISVLITGDDRGLRPTEPDGRSTALPTDRPLVETDVTETRFDVAVRGYRMAQVDVALRRVAYDIGYKEELIKVLRAEVDALREGRVADAETLRRAREAAVAAVPQQGTSPDPAEPAGAGGSDLEIEVRLDRPAGAEPEPEPAAGADEPAETPAEQPAEGLAEGPGEDSAEPPVDEPAEDPAEQADAAEQPAGTGSTGRG